MIQLIIADLNWLDYFVKTEDLCWELWPFLKFDLVSEAERGAEKETVMNSSLLRHILMF